MLHANNLKYKLLLILMVNFMIAGAQNVGIGTQTPVARLHVADSGVLFTGPLTIPDATNYSPAISGPGTRMLWYPQKAAFRAGSVDGAAWNKDNIGIYSFACGFNTIASNEAAVSMGYSNNSSGILSFTVGSQNIASGWASISMGEESYSTNSHALSIGYMAGATGQASTSLGRNNLASGNNSTSFGFYNTASGVTSTSMGSNTKAQGAVSTSMGSSTTAAGNYATAMGLFTTAKSDYSLVTGLNNDTSNTNRLFEIGNGESPSVRHNALTVLRNGNIGISTSAPATRLDVEGLNNWDLTNTEGDMRIGNNTYRIKMGIALDGGGAGAATIRAVGGIQQLNLGAGTATIITMNGATGFVGIGTSNPSQKLHVAGNIFATGTITPSDIRFKKNISLISDPLKKLQMINGVTYDYNTSAFPLMGFGETKQVGVIAQDVEKVFPELVYADDNGYKSVDYTKLVAVLIESVKEQQSEIDKLKKQVETLSKK